MLNKKLKSLYSFFVPAKKTKANGDVKDLTAIPQKRNQIQSKTIFYNGRSASTNHASEVKASATNDWWIN